MYFALCYVTMNQCMVSMEDLSLFYLDSSDAGAARRMSRAQGLLGFQTPPMQLRFGEEYVFALRYNNAFTDHELRRVTLKCTRPFDANVYV
jgi:hypothetical protein